MNTYKIRFLAFALAVIALISAVSCSKKTPTLSADGLGGYVDSKTEISYRGAPACFEARSYIPAEVIAENDGVAFYALDGVPSEEWLWSPDFGILLYARELTLPTLETFEAGGLAICVEEDARMQTAFDVTDAKKVEEILSAYLDGEVVPYSGYRARYTFYLKFYSEKYSWMYYNLLFVQYADDYIVYQKDENGVDVATNYGKNFIYNRSENRCVAIDDEMQKYVDEYFRSVQDGDSSETTGTEA